MEFRCKLSEVDDLIYDLVYDRTRCAVKEPIRTYEVHPTEESLGWGRSMVCEFDYTVHIPALKLFLRDVVEYEFDEEEQENLPIEGILHYYHEGDSEPIGGVYSNIRNHVLWYINNENMSIENAEELECVIDFPYDVDLKELEK